MLFRAFQPLLISFCLNMGFVLPTQGQSRIQSRVLDTDSVPVPYVNIGIPYANIGTVSQENGTFSLDIPDHMTRDTVWFSCVGYHTIKVPLAALYDLNGDKEIVMQKMEVSLPEVFVFRQQPRIRKIGTTTQHPLVSGMVVNQQKTDMVEHAKRINIRKPSLLIDASIYLKYPQVDSVTLRLNFYGVGADGMPGERIYHSALISKFPLKKGWLKFDLEAHGIWMEEPFFLGYEFLPNHLAHAGYPFHIGAQFGGASYGRQTSQGNWEKFTGAAIAGYVTVKQ